jgi:hypothetical protein
MPWRKGSIGVLISVLGMRGTAVAALMVPSWRHQPKADRVKER